MPPPWHTGGGDDPAKRHRSTPPVPQNLRLTNTGDEVPSRLRRLERRIVDRMAERALAQAGRTTPERTAGPWHHRFLGVLLALPVHLVTVVFGVGGVLLAFLGPTWPLQVVGGIGVLVAVGTRPSLPRRPEHDFRLTRADAAALVRRRHRPPDRLLRDQHPADDRPCPAAGADVVVPRPADAAERRAAPAAGAAR
jgi:hypothetical protein